MRRSRKNCIYVPKSWSYGRFKAKLNDDLFKRLENEPDGKLILVTAINPTRPARARPPQRLASVRLWRRSAKKAVIALREPSLGPVFGIKGGAAGGGYAQVLPMEDINLHLRATCTPSLRQIPAVRHAR